MTSKQGSTGSSSPLCLKNGSRCLISAPSRGNSAQFPGAYQAIVTGAFSIGPGVNDDRGGTFNTFVLGDDVSWSRGSHQFRFGGEGSYYELNRFNNFASRGSVTFGNTAAAGTGWFSRISCWAV